MIITEKITKVFDDIVAVDHIDTVMKDGSVFGLIGSNGAGKSTFLRMLAGVLKPDEGYVQIDGEDVWENIPLKRRCFLVPDDLYFLSGATPNSMAAYYASIYPKFDKARFDHLIKGFDLKGNRRIGTFSKGMRRQTALILAVCSGADYIFCDEAFDGLDPVARQTIKSIFINDMQERNMTPIIASHNLRELEDICDHVGLLHKGGILFSKDLDDMKLGIHKLHAAFNRQYQKEDFSELDIIKMEQRGSLITMTVRGNSEDIMRSVQARMPLFAELLPLSLEEIFISETEVKGYDIKKLIF
ncbi:MAG: ABC transporter ATP-binding protein [Clostridia bacterium]|nr:ABC transporter ATP-binding protein [Clostridia bacterium]